MISIKGGVQLLGLRPELAIAANIIDGIFEEFGHKDPDTGAHTVITSGVEGEHSRTSRHYVGLALDFRRRHLPKKDARLIASAMNARLGSEFVVLLKSTHFHIQFNGTHKKA
ncbi:MAG: hypothetical protein AAF627_07420 [Myxococcota bacterium]